MEPDGLIKCGCIEIYNCLKDLHTHRSFLSTYTNDLCNYLAAGCLAVGQ